MKGFLPTFPGRDKAVNTPSSYPKNDQNFSRYHWKPANAKDSKHHPYLHLIILSIIQDNISSRVTGFSSSDQHKYTYVYVHMYCICSRKLLHVL